MTDAPPPPAPRPARLLTFASGGWVILLTGLFAIIVMLIVLVPVVRSVANRPPGDGRNPASYGFDLSAATVPVETLVPAMHHRDLVRALTAPALMAAGEVEAFNGQIRGKYIVPDDLVAGVVVVGEARAYPLSVLAFHEVVNDTVGGVPIAVAYSPLSGAITAVERRVAGETVRMGISGLVHDSTHLLYDRRDGTGESLWHPLAAAPLAGPAVARGGALRRLPLAVTTWRDWMAHHPQTRVPRIDEAMIKRQRELSYDAYARSPELEFPAEPLPPGDGEALKTPCIVVFAGNEHRLYMLPDLVAAAGAEGVVHDEIGGEAVTLHVTTGPATAWASLGAEAEPAVAVYCYWFAWFAHEPDVSVGGRSS